MIETPMRVMVRFASLVLISCSIAPAQTTSGWKLVWSDEFNGPAGTQPDPAKWNYDLGNNNGWGNGEAENYTSSIRNVFEDGKGNLVIRAIRDAAGQYTSARLQTGSPGASTHTADLSWQYGRIEARIKLPFGKGVWPAFWMLGENIDTVGWPACGEVDIMENFGTFNNNISTNNGTVHGPGYSGTGGISKSYTLPLGQKVTDDYHLYAIEWSQDSIEWFVDGASYHKVTPASIPAGQKWVFNNPFFILLNLAVGGRNTFLGTPDANAPFASQDMLVDYVRVYQAASVTAATPVITPGRVVNAASYLGTIAPGSLATVYGNNLADAPHEVSAAPNFPTSVSNVTVSVNGVNAPLTFVSPSQINFQVPWKTPPGLAVEVKVTRNGLDSNVEPITISATSPTLFLSEFTNGVAWVTGTGCVSTECAVATGAEYQLWANGLGPKNAPQPDGVPAVYTGSLEPLEVPGSPGSCQLTIGGQTARVDYCGAGPGEIIDQVNFAYPAGVSPTAPYVDATLTINDVTGTFRVPAPSVALTSDQRADRLLSQMTLNEKLQLVAGAGGPVTNIRPLPRGGGGWVPGIPRLGIPDLYICDGSTGVANTQAFATALPSSIASAATWDLDLAYQYGKVIGAEMSAYGLNLNLGGNTNLIGREPRDGRTFETKGEDPVLAGKIAAAHLRATQDQNVLGVIKHFAFNDQETGRTMASTHIDERSARESDLLAFEIGIKESNVQSVMCSYNLVNGAYSCENPHLLQDVLKGDWGFQGFVMSDWWATHTTVAAAMAGLDQEQPDNEFFASLGEAVASGQVPLSRLDDMVHRILRAMYETGLFDHPTSIRPIDSVTDQAIAQQVEEQGAVLLKNAGGLPLNRSKIGSIAVIGSHADLGVLSGGGSAQVYPTGGPALNEGQPCPPCWAQVIWVPSSPLRAIQAKVPGASVRFDDGTNAAKAVSLAASSDVAIVFVSQWASEGMDIPSLNITDVIHKTPIDQDSLVSAIAAANPHTIVVMENGGPQVMPWLSGASAVLEAWYPGQRGGEAIANILFGDVNPSGKLPVTFPASTADLPHPAIAGSPDANTPFSVDYSEGLLVGYKWYDAKNITPRFPFGFGLSYTTFCFSNLNLTNTGSSGSNSLLVTFDVTNTGILAGSEVAQVYLGFPTGTGEPPRRLIGWQKVLLQPGETKSVALEVNENDPSHPLSYWDTRTSAWQVATGDYTVYVGNSSSPASLTIAGRTQMGVNEKLLAKKPAVLRVQ